MHRGDASSNVKCAILTLLEQEISVTGLNKETIKPGGSKPLMDAFQLVDIS
jgi:hypothetical protein